jgi:hypothetical protein
MKLSEIAATLREEDKMRLYLVSYLAVIEESIPDEPGKKRATTYNYASIVEAQDINMAKGVACARAEEQWPKSHGWALRSVTIDPIKPGEIKRLLEAWQAGLLAQNIHPPEKGIEVNCDTGITRVHTEIFIETDRPPS